MAFRRSSLDAEFCTLSSKVETEGPWIGAVAFPMSPLNQLDMLARTYEVYMSRVGEVLTGLQAPASQSIFD